MRNAKVVHVRVDNETHAFLKATAKADGRTMNSLIGRIIQLQSKDRMKVTSGGQHVPPRTSDEPEVPGGVRGDARS